MNRYLVEHNVPVGSRLTMPELESISLQSQRVIEQLDKQIQLLHTTITHDRMICLYEANDETAVREFARLSGLPIQWISKVSALIGPDAICLA